MGERSRRRSAVAAAGVVAWLTAVNVLRSTVVPSEWHPLVNGAAVVGCLAIGAGAGLDRDELGLARRAVPPGLRLGGAAFAAIAVPVAVAAAVPAAEPLFSDPRAEIGVGELFLRALVVIPIGTVLVEELAFRGVLHGLLVRLTSRTGVYALGAGIFGLWHLLPTARGALDDGSAAVPITAGTVVATTVAGLGFVWLRERSGSVVAPMLAHVATNSSVLVAAWVVAR